MAYQPKKICRRCKQLRPCTHDRKSWDRMPPRKPRADYYRWYQQPWWRLARAKQLYEHPHCAECFKNKNKLVRATQVDHITPHKGEEKLFFATSNMQSLCATCHTQKTLAENNFYHERKKNNK